MASCTLDSITTFIILSLGRYLCCWTISLIWNHPSSSKCFGPNMVYLMYILLQFILDVQINTTKVLLPSGIDDLSLFMLSCLGPFVFLLPKTLNLFDYNNTNRFSRKLLNKIEANKQKDKESHVLVWETRKMP